MKPPPFAYERPTSVEGTLAALARHGEGAKLLAGGQSLIAMLNLRLLAPKTVIDVNRLKDLDYVRFDGGELAIGALTRHNTVLRSKAVAEHCALMVEAYRFVSHPNYWVVVGEIAVLPLVFGLPEYALVFSLLNAAILAVRIRAEGRALGNP